MSSMRIARALAAVAVVGALVLNSPTFGAPSPHVVPTSIIPPFSLPMLEGAQAKVEIGVDAPAGVATSFWGNQPASMNFSVWWWDTGPAIQARLWLDGGAHAMSPSPTSDGDDTNGTLYVVKVPITSMAEGPHSYYFNFSGPSGQTRFPRFENFTNLVLDEADRFLTGQLLNFGRQVNLSYRASTIPTLREVVNQTALTLDPLVGTDWDAANGYPYTDANRFTILPSAAVASAHEAFVVASGASRAGFTDALNFVNNSEPAIKQALLLRGALLATSLFNESDIELVTETMVVNLTTYAHPFLRVALRDGSEAAGDGPVDGDGSMDVDLWALGLPTPVALGSHFGEDYDETNEALWDGDNGWPPAQDTNTQYVLAPYKAVSTVRAPDGTFLDFYEWESQVKAVNSWPYIYGSSWMDEPVLFDGANSTQSVGVDLTYEWSIINQPLNSFGAVWTVPIPAVGQYNATLTVRDAFGEEDTIIIPFFLHGQTKTEVQMPDVTFPEDGRYAMDLRVFFGDADGFETIQFTFNVTPAGTVAVERFPSQSPSINLTTPQDWCGSSFVTVHATDGTSAPVEQSFNVTVTCVNDVPLVHDLPGIVIWAEDGSFSLGPMSAYVSDPDPEPLTWSYSGAAVVNATYDPQTGLLVFTAPANWSGVNAGIISVTDGIAQVNRTLTAQVLASNDPPITLGIPTLDVDEDAANATFFLSLYFSDPDGDQLAAAVTAFPGVEAGYSTVLRQVWYHPALNFVGATSFSLRVSDPSGGNITVVVNLNVRAVNDPPVVDETTPPGYVTAAEGAELFFAVDASDPDDTTLTYAFELDGEPQGQSFDGTFGWQTSYQSAGRHVLCVTITDGAGATAEHCWQIQISPTNRAPIAAIERPAAATFTPGQNIDLSAEASDPDGDALAYTWSFGGILQPKSGQNITIHFGSAGNFTVKLTVTDGVLSTEVTTVIEIVYNLPPDTNCTTCPPPPPPPPPFIPDIGTLGAVGAFAAAAILFVVAARRRR